MKTITTTLLLVAAASLFPAPVITAGTYYGSSASIPDGSPVGVTQQFTVSGLGGTVANVQVQLDITGGFNGDLYAYLLNPQGQMAVLLNRVGVTAGNAFGYSDSGMNVILDGLAANNIHDYGSLPSYSLNGTTWAADGRGIDPQSAGSLFDAGPTGASLSLYQNTDANGVWTFFIADLSSGGGLVNVSSVAVTITNVPEPQQWLILGAGLSLLWLSRKRV